VSPPSDPQLFLGSAMVDKLPRLEGVLRARRASGTI
jgi:hypothetical protein